MTVRVSELADLDTREANKAQGKGSGKGHDLDDGVGGKRGRSETYQPDEYGKEKKERRVEARPCTIIA